MLLGIPDTALHIIGTPSKRLLMKIPGNWPIFYYWPFQKLLHFLIPDSRVQSNVVIPEQIMTTKT